MIIFSKKKNFFSAPRKSHPAEISASEGQKLPFLAKNRPNKKISKSHKSATNVEKQHFLLSATFCNIFLLPPKIFGVAEISTPFPAILKFFWALLKKSTFSQKFPPTLERLKILGRGGWGSTLWDVGDPSEVCWGKSKFWSEISAGARNFYLRIEKITKNGLLSPYWEVVEISTGWQKFLQKIKILIFF